MFAPARLAPLSLGLGDASAGGAQLPPAALLRGHDNVRCVSAGFFEAENVEGAAASINTAAIVSTTRSSAPRLLTCFRKDGLFAGVPTLLAVGAVGPFWPRVRR